ncbi:MULTISPECIES: hypothetical protein [Paraburkholderia]|uniref:Uncharacterized protein n=1 Tax=Paraburkholderia acidicola TaxID=1912599 RepID=A0ABV1M1S4_9BURK
MDHRVGVPAHGSLDEKIVHQQYLAGQRLIRGIGLFAVSTASVLLIVVAAVSYVR